MLKRAKEITLTDKQYQALVQISTSRTQKQHYIERTKIILLCAESTPDRKIAHDLGIHEQTVQKWRVRWYDNKSKLEALDEKENGIAYSRKLLEILSDEERPGTPPKFTAEEVCQMISLSCERPEESGLPLSHWSLDSLVEEIKKRGIVKSISRSRLAIFLKSGRDKTAQSKRLVAYPHRG